MSALKAEPRPDGEFFSGQWRLRLGEPGAGSGANRSFSTGVQTDTQAKRESGVPGLYPPDLSDWTSRYVADSLKKLGEMASVKGARAAAIGAISVD